MNPALEEFVRLLAEIAVEEFVAEFEEAEGTATHPNDQSKSDAERNSKSQEP
jgi:hypothetical protein